MRLEMGVFPVREIVLGRETKYEGGRLEVDAEAVDRLARESPQVVGARCEVAAPGESVRVPYVLDAVEPRLKLGGPGCVFPGVLGGVETVGSGRTQRLAGMAVVASGAIPLYLLPVAGAASSATVRASAVGAQVLNISFQEGLFPFSPFSHTSSPPHFGLDPGTHYTLRWGSGFKPCAGDDAPQYIAQAKAGGADERGYIEETSSAIIRSASGWPVMQTSVVTPAAR